MRKFLLSIFAILLVSVQLVLAQSQVRGVVNGSDGEPVIGATVLLKGTQRGTVTNSVGGFEINVPANSVLVISSIGYIPTEVNVGNRTRVDVLLEADAQSIGDVMVVAFGTATKEAFTGSASVLKNDDIVKRQVSNVSRVLEGQVPGVQMVSTTGQPGSAGSIRIRGVGSLAASSAPLYVVDGVPFDGDISSLNGSDIESMTVLKDAASNALYGARGANGVILITTKKGRLGEAVVNMDARWGVNSRGVPEYDIMRSPQDYIETLYAAKKNQYLTLGRTPQVAHNNALTLINNSSYSLGGYQPYTIPAGEALIDINNGKLNPNATLGRLYRGYYLLPDNWGDAAYNNELRQEYNFNASGATEKLNVFFSGGYLKDEGYVVRSNFERISTRLRADYQAKSWLKIGANASYANTFSNNPSFSETGSDNMFYVTRNMSPVFPLYVRDADGNILRDTRDLKIHDYGDGINAGLQRPFMSMANPVSAQAIDTRQINSDIFSGKAYAEVSFLQDFKAMVNAGVDVNNARTKTSANGFYGQYQSMGGWVNVEHGRSNAVNFQQLLTWGHNYGLHHVDALLGHETYDLKMNEVWGQMNKMYNHDITEVDNAIKSPSTGSNADRYKTEGFLGRVQYDYAHKYFFSGSYRRDASSRFHPNHRWGNFWSVGGSWLMSSEEFMQNVSWIDMLKVKASFGSQGNDKLLNNGENNYYPYLDNYQLVNYDDNFALVFNYRGNEKIKWETSYNFNTGVEFGIFGNRLTGGVEFFMRTTKDLLFNRPVPPSLGFSTFPDNIGKMRNTGVEFELHGTPIETRNFRWSIFVNGTHYKNKILTLPPEYAGIGLVNGRFRWTEGGSLYDYYTYEWAGVDSETGTGLWYKDGATANAPRETTNNYNLASRYQLGKSALPTLYGGFGTTFEFYGVDASINFTYQLGGWGYDTAYAGLMHNGNSSNDGYNWHNDILNAWTPENRNSAIPQVNSNYIYVNYNSSRFLTRATYLNIQNITIGYTLPKSLTGKLGMNSVRVYAVADNVALFSARKGYDPRQAFNGIANLGMYAPIRTISGGIQLQF